MLNKIIKAFIPSKKVIQMFSYQVSSNHPIESIIEKVVQECEKHKFSVLQTYVYHEILEGKGFPIQRKVYVYEICQAKTASMMLTNNPEFSLFMPCKLAIYESEGKTVISTMNMGMVLQSIQSNAGLYMEAINLFETIKLLMKALAEE